MNKERRRQSFFKSGEAAPYLITLITFLALITFFTACGRASFYFMGQRLSALIMAQRAAESFSPIFSVRQLGR